MWVIQKQPNGIGSYPSQTWNMLWGAIPEGYIEVPETFVSVIETYGTWVQFEIVDNEIVSMTDNIAGKEAYEASLPPPPPPAPPQPSTGAIQRAAIKCFVYMAEKGEVTPTAEDIDIFNEWAPDTAYVANNYCKYGGKLYKCITGHTSQADWTPDAAASLWYLAADPSEPWPDWRQPLGSFDAYPDKAHVSHDGRHWESTVQNNVWEPGVYGWDEVV